MHINYQIITSVVLIICIISLIFVFLAWDADLKALQEKINKLGCEAILGNLTKLMGGNINPFYFNYTNVTSLPIP